VRMCVVECTGADVCGGVYWCGRAVLSYLCVMSPIPFQVWGLEFSQVSRPAVRELVINCSWLVAVNIHEGKVSEMPRILLQKPRKMKHLFARVAAVT